LLDVNLDLNSILNDQKVTSTMKFLIIEIDLFIIIETLTILK
jgi:hypothetical protein